MTPNPYAPFRRWRYPDNPGPFGPGPMSPSLWILDWHGVVRPPIGAIKALVDDGHRFVISIRDPSLNHPLLDALADNDRVILALRVERQTDLERLTPRIHGLWIAPAEDITHGLWCCNGQMCGCRGIGPFEGLLHTSNGLRIVIAHGEIGDQRCRACNGTGTDQDRDQSLYGEPCEVCGGSCKTPPAPCSPAWLDSIVAECQHAGVPVCVPAAGSGEWSLIFSALGDPAKPGQQSIQTEGFNLLGSRRLAASARALVAPGSAGMVDTMIHARRYTFKRILRGWRSHIGRRVSVKSYARRSQLWGEVSLDHYGATRPIAWRLRRFYKEMR